VSYSRSNLALRLQITNLIEIKSTSFTESLIQWYQREQRPLPWRKTRDPYRIWLSEIILQQTRVQQGLPYYEAIIEAFPSVADLANAEEDEVLALWQGLGYYSRARNLMSAARQILQEYGGVFPKDYQTIIRLKGVGPYTAAAIASICFNAPTPVVDGNVFRFISRVYGIYKDVSIPATRKCFEQYLSALIDTQRPGLFNQAMMECGALICKPKPDCDQCPVREHCYAFAHQEQAQLPVKTKKLKPRKRVIDYVVIYDGEHIFLKKRGMEDIWKGLYDFPAISVEETKDVKIAFTRRYTHQLTHQTLYITFYVICEPDNTEKFITRSGVKPITLFQALNLPKPKPVVTFLRELQNQIIKNDDNLWRV